MAIEIQCECCDSKIRVKDELAGRSGSCRRCGSSITIPPLEELPQSQPLGKASPRAIVEEFRRRGLRTMLLMVDGDDANSIAGDQLSEGAFKLQAIGAEAFNQEQLAAVYRRLADDAEHRQTMHKSQEAELEDDVFALKGDKLGMSLGDFKQKHHRRVANSERIAPLCSDEFPGQTIKELLAEPWHVAAGIVHARVDLPEENAAPTIAGVRSELVLYQFIDTRLFQVSSFFGPDSFHVLNAALTKKFGSPVDYGEAPRSARWWSMSSTIELVSGSIRPLTPTALSYRHDELLREASKRKPDPLGDL